MEKIPTKQQMIEAVSKSGCENIRRLDLLHMDRLEMYSKLLTLKCPCLEALMNHNTKHRPHNNKE
jgi:hypothetical protein